MSRDILLSVIDRDAGQPRQHFDEDALTGLVESMAVTGQVVPLLVRPDGDRYVIVHGERRWRAAQRLGWETIRAEVRDVTAEDARWLSLVENVQRQDLSPIEEAVAFRDRLAEGVTQAELGRRIGKSQSYVAQKLRLLQLPDEVQGALARRELTEGHGRQLLKLDDPAKQAELCDQAVGEKWTVAQLQEAVDMAKPLTPEERAVRVGDRYRLMPPLSQDEYDMLKADIAVRGVQVPVEFDDQGNVLDGHHRLKACRELGIKDYPSIVRVGLTEDEKIEHLVIMNVLRRQLPHNGCPRDTTPS